MKRYLLLICLFFCLAGCSLFEGPTFRVGIDPSWLMTNSGGKEALITGFMEEVLLEISADTGISFERLDGSWDDLLQNLQSKRYEGIISSLPPYDFHRAEYDFSNLILATGPILIVPKDSKVDSLEDLSHRTVAYLQGSPALLVLQGKTQIQIEPYTSMPLALNDLVKGKSKAALLDYLPAANYVKDLYEKKLKIVGKPLTNEGLRMVYLKGMHEDVQSAFSKSLKKLKKDKRYQELLKKWDLNSSL